MAKQKLTPTAKRMKAIRDKKAAMTADRRKKKAENQRKRRKAKKEGKNIEGKDYDHKDRKFKSVKANRGNDGKGTKREGFSTKTMKKTSKSRNTGSPLHKPYTLDVGETHEMVLGEIRLKKIRKNREAS